MILCIDVDSFQNPDGSAAFEGGSSNLNKKYCADVGTYDYTAYPSSNPTPQVPGDSQIITIYCEHLVIEGAKFGHPVQPDCPGTVASQINDDAYRWRQYDLDWHTMHDYTTLTTNQ